MKVGDLVRYNHVPHPYADEEQSAGIVLEIHKTGRKSDSVKVHFTDGSVEWYDSAILEKLSDGT